MLALAFADRPVCDLLTKIARVEKKSNELLGRPYMYFFTEIWHVKQVHPSCKRSRKFSEGWVDGSIHFISKECIISPKFLQKALVWLSNLDSELR